MKYRLIKQVDNSVSEIYSTKYVIEKRVGFLFIKWWSQNYLFYDEKPCYWFADKESALKFMEILNGKKEHFTKTLIA